MAANRCFFSVVIRAATIALAAMMVIVNKLTPVGYAANQHETPHDSHSSSFRFSTLAIGEQVLVASQYSQLSVPATECNTMQLQHFK
jgi:hypothetical protein